MHSWKLDRVTKLIASRKETFTGLNISVSKIYPPTPTTSPLDAWLKLAPLVSASLENSWATGELRPPVSKLHQRRSSVTVSVGCAFITRCIYVSDIFLLFFEFVNISSVVRYWCLECLGRENIIMHDFIIITSFACVFSQGIIAMNDHKCWKKKTFQGRLICMEFICIWRWNYIHKIITK